MEKTRIRKVFFKKLKGLNDVEISFSDTLTAIMGVNGSGKTTVIHALACIYQPDGKGENHRFPEFFVPNTDSLWNGSDFEVVNETEDNRRQRVILPSREYSKFFDRWSPHYDRRPKRNVYYLGIDTCLPDIEKTSAPRIIYHSLDRTDRQATKTIEYSSYILNKSYRHLLDNTYYNKHFTGVQLESGLKYSSLSMGSGEQRVIKIISVLLAAEPFSLVLIDEIDLLLHVSALKRLIEIIHDIAVRKNIQVVFTTHSLEMIQLSRYVSIQYIHNLELPFLKQSLRLYCKAWLFYYARPVYNLFNKHILILMLLMIEQLFRSGDDFVGIVFADFIKSLLNVLIRKMQF